MDKPLGDTILCKVALFYTVCCSFTLYVEAAANGMFGAGRGGLINPPDPNREFSLLLAEVAMFEQDVYDLMMDITVIYDMSKVWY